MNNKFLKVALSFCLLSLPAVASEAQQSIRQCAQITQNDARLACFDKLAGSVVPQAQKKQKAVAPAAPVISSSTAKNKSQQADDFGEHHLKKAAESEELDRVIFTIAKVSYSPQKRLKLTFKNGQRWNQSDSERLTLKAGDKVELFKGVWSAVYLKKVGFNRKIRVKRVK